MNRARRPYTWLTAPVRVSSRLSCGCTFKPSEPLPAAEAMALPGRAVICDVHDEYAVVVRVTTRLVDTAEVLRDLLLPLTEDELIAECVAGDQAGIR